ncbi:hypothetical protein XGA_0961 [Xanthomonas hortorum ATCC 19865]|nr:hypothetical protein XGA_0961 [Xanthomonas hortorum ATCC 19865]
MQQILLMGFTMDITRRTIERLRLGAMDLMLE